MWRRHVKRATTTAPVADNFCDWVANLPYVIERSPGLSDSGHIYEVSCEPLAQRALWLMVDCETSKAPESIIVILPSSVAREALRAGWGTCYTPMLADRYAFKLDRTMAREEVEAIVLSAYCSAVPWE
jgi:hypothetical protein